MTHVLIVDDEIHFRNTLASALRAQGHRVTALEDDERLAPTIAINHPDVILLDLMFESGVSGMDICRRLRRWSAIPVIIGSVRDDEQTVVDLLDAGADDYLVKPFGIDELLARVRAVQRRIVQRSESPSPLITIDHLTIDLDKEMLFLNNQPLHMTRKELGVMRLLAQAGGGVVSYKKFLNVVWELDDADKYVYVRNVIKRIRHKLGEDLGNPHYILTDGTRGYRLGTLTADDQAVSQNVG
jgi:two-component system KDP operon response regulator KdpE